MMETEEEPIENGFSNYISRKVLEVGDTAENIPNPEFISMKSFVEDIDECNDNGSGAEPFIVGEFKDLSEENDEIKENILDLSVHSKCRSDDEGDDFVNDESVRECMKTDDEDVPEECVETKDEILDLTIHCESRLSEDDESEEENESLALEEECVDPLEFLEVDQSVVAGSSDSEEPQGESNHQRSTPVDESTPLDTSHQDTVENNVPLEEHLQQSLKESIPIGYIICEKCGYLKNISKYQRRSRRKNNGIEKHLLCVCAIEKFHCKQCGKYIKVVAYDYHMLRHKRASDHHKCELCGKTFLDAVNLRNHILIIHDGHVYSCDTCGKSFRYTKSLKCHLASCSKRKYYKCNVCGESFITKRPLLSHLRTHEDTKIPEEPTNICEICCIVFDNSSSKKDHIMEVHVAAQRFVCSTCGEAFVTESSMKRHKLTHERSYPCKMCDTKFPTQRDLKVHMTEHRTLKDTTCKGCGDQFGSSAAFMNHKLSQSCKGNPKSCEICTKTFKDSTALKKHLVVHTPLSERSVTCDICQRKFSGNSALKKHLRLIHADARPYTCEFCSKSFNQLCKLKYHIVSHASDKPVICDICNKGFSSDKDIKIHMLTHTGEKPFKCNICGKSFRQRGHVKTHQLVHTREKPFSCDICSKTFGLPSSLKKHVKLHSSNSSIVLISE